MAAAADQDDLEFAFEEAAPAATLVLGKKKKKKKKPAVLPDAADEGDEGCDGASEATRRDKEGTPLESPAPIVDDGLDELAAMLAKKKKKKKSKPSRNDDCEQRDSAAILLDSEGTGVHAEVDDENNRRPRRSSPDANGHAVADDDDNDERGAQSVPSHSAKSAKGKKKYKGKGGDARQLADADVDDIDAILAELDLAPTDGSRQPDVPGQQPLAARQSAALQKKGKKKPPAVSARADDDIDAILAELDDHAGEQPTSAHNLSSAPAQSTPSAAAAADDIDALMAEMDAAAGDGFGSSKKTSAAAGKNSKKKGKAKKDAAHGGAAGGVDADDLDVLLAQLGDGPTVAAADDDDPAPDTLKCANGDATALNAEDLDAMLEETGPDGGPKLSAAAKKKAAKKKKAKTVADAAGAIAGDGPALDAPAVETQTTASVSLGAKKVKKESAAVKRLRELKERQSAEQERLDKLREVEEKRLLEEERLEQEREEALAASKRTKKEAEKAKKARLKAEGKLLSKAEAAKRRKAEAFRQQALASGLVPAALTTSSLDATARTAVDTSADDAARGRIIYGKKKRGKADKGNEDGIEVAPLDTSGKPIGGTVHSQVDGTTENGAVDVCPIMPTESSAPAVEEVVPDEWEDAEVLRGIERANAAAAKALAVGKGNSVVAQTNEYHDDNDNDANDDDKDSGSDFSADDDDDSEHEGMSKAQIAAEKRRDEIRKIRVKELAVAMAARSIEDLRSPIICILGHVDTGKTKILDRIRRTNVQDGEAGGITQQIGATYFPIEAVKKETTKLEEGRSLAYNVPSLLIIDTPGHESFTNLRSRGSSLCDIAILVVDIMHGLEQQTRESIDLLKLRKTPFIVALNKVDRMYDWNNVPGNSPIRDSLAQQKKHVVDEFRRRTKEAQLQFQEIGFNTELYWENSDVRKNISIVPTSAITGEGIPDLLMLLLSLTQKLLVERLMFCSVLESTVLEVKVIEGLGTTIDIVLTGGTIREGDTIFVVGLDGPIQTTVRALLTPHPMKEMRVKGQYVHHKEIRAAQGIKISADGLDKAVAGTQIMVAKDPSDTDEVEFIKEEVMKDFSTILQNVDKSGMGVYVQASTLGSLEALLEFLRTSEIPVSGINIGPVHKRDVTKASTMLEKRKEFATILAFDVPIEREAREMAEEMGVTIFTADIIYHLFDQFTDYMQKVKQTRREQVNNDVVFPVILRILRDNIFHNKDPIVMGVDVVEGILRVGTPLVVRHGTEWLDIGRVVSIEHNMQSVKTAKRGETVCLKVQSPKTEHIMYGRHFDFQDEVVSKMSREAINILKENFRDDLDKEDWRLVVKLKTMFEII